MTESVQQGVGKPEESEHAFDFLEHHTSVLILAGAGLFMIAVIIGNFLHRKHIAWLPESLVVIALGAIGGICFRSAYGHEFSLESDSVINEDLLQNLLLPIIIFEAGWSLRNKEFISQLPYILIFAVLGTVICMVVVALLMVATSHIHGVTGYRIAFTYGALIAAVDPVATLSTYAHLNVEPLLNIMVMGESIINDAVAITLFDVLNDYHQGEDEPLGKLIGGIVLETILLLLGSIALGLALGMLLSFVVRVAGLRHNPHAAILFVFVSAYFSYHAAANAHLSGIICVLFEGMMMSGYVPAQLSLEGSLLTSFLLKQMASLADMTVFLFVGIAIAFSTYEGLLLGLWIMLFCLVGRALATFPLAIGCNLIKAQAGKGLPKEKQLMITPRHMFMMWHAGLRGGIALVLCLTLGDWVDREVKSRLIQATTLLICVFLLVFGGSTEFFLRRLGIPVGDPPPMYLSSSSVGRFLGMISKRILKPVLKGKKKDKQDITMEGSVVRHIMKEARIKNDVDRMKARKRDEEDRWNRFDMFGHADPVRMDSGWLPDDPEDDRWMDFYHHASSGHEGSMHSSDSSAPDELA